MSYLNGTFLLNSLLHDLGQEQDADEGQWAYDKVEAQAWFTANHPDGRLVQVWIDHVSSDALGTQALTLTPGKEPGVSHVELVPAPEVTEGDVLSTDGYVVTTVVVLPKTERVFIQTRLGGDIKTVTVRADCVLPIWTADSNSVIAAGREEAYERKVQALEQRWDNELLSIALSATEAYITPEASADEVVDQVKDALEVVLFGNLEWEGVEATDISDVALDFANRAWSQTRAWAG